MADYEIPPPEPKPIDEQNWLKLKDLMERATLRGHPYENERCDNCLYYLNPDDGISYAGTSSCGSSSVATGGASGGRPSRRIRDRHAVR